MLLKKLKEPFETEYPIPHFDPETSGSDHDLSKAVIALVTSGGIVPRQS